METFSAYGYSKESVFIIGITTGQSRQGVTGSGKNGKNSRHKSNCNQSIFPAKVPFIPIAPRYHSRQYLCASTSKKVWERKNDDLTNDIDIGMLGIGEFAIRMGVCSNTVRNWIADGKLIEGIHYLHHGRIYRFPWSREFVDRLMQSLVTNPPPTRPGLRSHRTNRTRLKLRA